MTASGSKQGIKNPCPRLSFVHGYCTRNDFICFVFTSADLDHRHTHGRSACLGQHVFLAHVRHCVLLLHLALEVRIPKAHVGTESSKQALFNIEVFTPRSFTVLNTPHDGRLGGFFADHGAVPHDGAESCLIAIVHNDKLAPELANESVKNVFGCTLTAFDGATHVVNTLVHIGDDLGHRKVKSACMFGSK